MRLLWALVLLAAVTGDASARTELPHRAGQADRHHRRGRRARRHRAHRRRRPVAALGPAGVRHQSSGRGRLDRHEGRGLLAAGRLHAPVRAVVELRRAAGDRQGLSLRSRSRLRLDRLRLRAADGDRGAGLARHQHARRIDRPCEEAAGRDQRRGAEPRRHSASDVGVDQAGGRAGMDLDQLSRHAGRPVRRHGRPRAGHHGRPAEPRRRGQRRPAQAHRRRRGEAPAEPARDADHCRDAACAFPARSAGSR